MMQTTLRITLKNCSSESKKKRKFDQSTTETPIDVVLAKLKEDFSKASEEIENVEYDPEKKLNKK